MKKRKLLTVLAAIVAAAAIAMPLTSCSAEQNSFIDGYYTAETDKFDSHGWKEYVTICVSGGKIVTVEYNARNLSGMIKSWDMNYMRVMNAVAGSYPNQYTRAYASDILNHQNADNVDAVSGATHSYHTFELLAASVIDLAMQGTESIVFVTAEE